MKLSFSKSYLWATSRARQSDQVGYISAFTLSESGSIDSQIFLLPTTSSGGSENAVTPIDFSDQYVALTDSETGFLQVWKFNGKSAEVAATLALEDGGCCANTVWYD